MCRKKVRRPTCGARQNCVPLILLQSNPNLSFMVISPASITEQKIQLVDANPGQIFKGGGPRRGRSRLLQVGERMRTLVGARFARQERQEQLIEQGGIVGDLGNRGD